MAKTSLVKTMMAQAGELDPRYPRAVRGGARDPGRSAAAGKSGRGPGFKDAVEAGRKGGKQSHSRWDADGKCRKCKRPGASYRMAVHYEDGIIPGFSVEGLEHSIKNLKDRGLCACQSEQDLAEHVQSASE